uniref:Uncharacterized protein n=1 Tax=Mustela putorius furo TaxID=9669 RepID=M3Z3W2_MUSPF
MEQHLLQQECGRHGLGAPPHPPRPPRGFLRKGVGRACGRAAQGQQVPPPGVPPATHLLRVKEPMAVQAQPSLLPAEAAQLPLEMLERARLWQSRDPLKPPAQPPWHTLTLEPVQPSRAKGSWLTGTATRSTRTARLWAPPAAAPGECGRQKMQKLLSKASMVLLCRVRCAASSGWPRWCWWYRTRPCGPSRWGRAAGQSQGRNPSPTVLPAQAAPAPHLPLQAVHHVGQEPCHQALLGMAEQQVHIVAVQLTPAGAPSTRLTRATQGCGSHALPGPRSKACSMPSPRAFRPPHLRKPPTSVTVAPGRMSTAAASTSCCKASASGRCTGMLSSR